MSYISGIGNGGFSTPVNYQPELKNANAQTGGTENLNLYQQFTGWQIAADKAASTVAQQQVQEKYDNGEYTSDEDQQIEIDFNNFYNEAINFTEDFSFTQGEAAYVDQAKTLAQEHIQTYDTIKADGIVDYEEYTAKELADYNAQYAESLGVELTLESEGVEELFKTSFEFFDLDGDKTISENETAAYYTALDILDGALDGKIKYNTCNMVSECLTPDATEDGTLSFADELKSNNRTKLKQTMTEIYNTNFAPEISGEENNGTTPAEPENNTPAEPQQTIEPGVQTNIGKSAAAIEKNLIAGSPFEVNTAQGCEIL